MNTGRNIVLIGYRGTGKSTIAAVLAARLNRPVISIDKEIARNTGLEIAEIIRTHDWDYFRRLEAIEVEKAAAKSSAVIDPGGGIVLSADNVSRLKQNGIFFYLSAKVDTLRQRLENSQDRPSLTGGDFLAEIETILALREPLYRKAADHIIATDGKSTDDVAAAILDIFQVAGDDV